MADSGRLVKMEVDYSDAVDKALPECQELAKVGVRRWEGRFQPFSCLLRAAQSRRPWRSSWR